MSVVLIERPRRACPRLLSKASSAALIIGEADGVNVPAGGCIGVVVDIVIGTTTLPVPGPCVFRKEVKILIVMAL